MFDLTSAIQGGLLSVVVLLGAHIALAPIKLDLRLAAAGFLAGIATHAVIDPATNSATLALLFCLLNPVFLWWMVMCIFDEDPPYQRVGVLMLGFLVLHTALPEPLADPLVPLASVALMMHLVYRSLQGLSEDLVQSRRAFRLSIGLVLPLVSIGFALVLAFPPAGAASIHQTLLAIDLVLALGFAAWMTALRLELFVQPRPSRTADLKAESDTRTLSQMLASGIHRREGLTIGALSAELGWPEHRTRSVINAQMGYRNFNALLNDLRIDDAKAQLCDPERRELQISQIAYAAGFSSLAPFNRAFRDRTGQSPSAFRRDHGWVPVSERAPGDISGFSGT